MKNSTDRRITIKAGIFTMLSFRLPLLLTSVLLISILSACSYPSIKSRDALASEPFGGAIIDEETGKPIPNAVVMMRWPRAFASNHGTYSAGAIEIDESITDAEGRYAIAGWVKGKDEIFGVGFIYKMSPVLTIFAPGYWPTTQRNKGFDILQQGESWKAGWDGKAIGLKPMDTETWNHEQWQEYFSTTKAYLSIDDLPQCAWLKIPNYYIAKHRVEVKEYKAPHRVRTDWHNISDRKLIERTYLYRIVSEEQNCAVEPKAFFHSHGMSNEEFDECCSDIPGTRDSPNRAVR